MKKTIIFLTITAIILLSTVFSINFDASALKYNKTIISKFDTLKTTQSEFNRIYHEFFDARSNNVLVVAHRGDWKVAPENSLKSLQSCIEMGVDIIEIDIQRTSDGVLILMHDGTVNRTTNGKGRISRLTYNQIKKLKLRMNDGTWTDERVPTLTEAMLLCKGKCLVNLDKAYRYWEQVSQILDSTDTFDHAILKGSGRANDVQGLLDRQAFIPVFMPILWGSNSNSYTQIQNYINDIEPPAFEIIFRYENDSIISPNYVFLMKKGNARIWTNAMFESMCGGHGETMKPYKNWDWLMDRGINIIQTDQPRTLLQYLRLKGKHW